MASVCVIALAQVQAQVPNAFMAAAWAKASAMARDRAPETDIAMVAPMELEMAAVMVVAIAVASEMASEMAVAVATWNK